MNVEQIRRFCLGIAPDVEERMPFGAFRCARDVLVFYVAGHMFCFFDLNNFGIVTLKCDPDEIPVLRETYEWVGAPYNMNPKYWIGLRADVAPDDLTKRLIINSYNIVKQKHEKK